MELSHKLFLGFGFAYYFVGTAFLVLSPTGLSLLGVEGTPGPVLALSTLFFGGYALSNRCFRFRRSPPTSPPPLVAAYTSSILLLSGGALVAALTLGLDSLMISRFDERVPGRLLQLINLHLAGSFLAAVLWGSRREDVGLYGRALVAFAFATSFLIGIAEGRRTAVALPALFLLLSWWLGRRTMKGGYLLPILVVGFGIAGVVATTLSRAGAPLDAVTAALGLRLFNPAVMLSAIIEAPIDFDPATIRQIGRRLGASFLGLEYQSLTNDFGVAMGYLSPQNYVVGINYGIVCEAFLWGGYLGVLFWAVALERLVEAATIVARGPVMNGELIIGLLAAHGLQMEIPYTVVAILKGAVAVLVARWGISLLSSFWRSLKVTPETLILDPARDPTT